MKVRILVFGVVTALLLASCFSPVSGDGSTGSISITVPSLSDAGISGSAVVDANPVAPFEMDPGYYARVFVYRGESQAGFGEVAVSSDTPSTLTIAGIPEGDDYSLAVTIGRKRKGALFPEKYGTKGLGSPDTFSITGGRITPVSVNVQDSPFFYGLAGEALKGIAKDEQGALITSSATTIYAITPPEDTSVFVGAAASVTPSPSFTINGIDQGSSGGSEVAWLSGLNRIYEADFDGFAFVTPTSDNLIPPGAFDGSRNILSAVGYTDELTYAMFQFDGGLGGGEVGGTTADWGDTGDQLKDFVSGQPVLDIVAFPEDGTALFATKLGAFVADNSLFDEDVSEEELTEAFITGEDREGLMFIELTIGGEVRQVSTIVAVDRDPLSESGDFVFFGTARGVYAAIDPVDAKISADTNEARLVPGTSGMQVTDIAVLYDDPDDGGYGATYMAALGRSRLVIRNLKRGVGVAIPVVAGVPGLPAVGRFTSGVKGMTLAADYDNTGEMYLGFAGDFGFSAIRVRSLLGEPTAIMPQ